MGAGFPAVWKDKDKSESEEHFNISLMREALDLAKSCISLLRQSSVFFKNYTRMKKKKKLYCLLQRAGKAPKSQILISKGKLSP